MREHAVADGEGVAGDPACGAGSHAPVGVERGDGHRLQPFVAVCLDDRVPGEQRDAVAKELSRVLGALGDLARLGGERAGPSYEGLGAGGLDECGHLDARGREAGRHGEEERAGAGDHGGASGDGEGALEHGLGAARGEDSRQGPAGEREDLLVATGGEEDCVRAHLDRGLLTGTEEGVHGEGGAAVGSGLVAQPPLHEPDMMIRQVGYVARLHVVCEGVVQSLPCPPLVVQGLGAAGVESGGGLAVELAARLWCRVDQGDADAVGRGGHRGGESRRARADDGEVRSVVSHRGPFPPACG